MLRKLKYALESRWPYRGEARTLPEGVQDPRAMASPAESRPLLERILNESIVSRWYPGVIDHRLGGYRPEMDETCRWMDGPARYLMTHARTLWFFSRLAQSTYGGEGYAEAARHGFRFLSERMWDREYGGFFWQVNASTGAVAQADKDTCGQSFGLYGLSEFAAATGDQAALALADETFRVLEEKAKDPHHPGYVEMLSRDWRAGPKRSYHGRYAVDKTVSAHLHLMESYTAYWLLTRREEARSRLEELVWIVRNGAFRPMYGASSDRHRPDWSPLKGDWNRTSYGHDLEGLWLMVEALQSLGVEPADELIYFRTIFASNLRDGFDTEKGGWSYWGRHQQPARRRQKLWWVQAEALVASLRMFYLTGEDIYFEAYRRTLHWLLSAQIDWQGGEWHKEIAPTGRPLRRAKGDRWKCCYHNGRAILSCLDLIDERTTAQTGTAKKT